MGYKESSLRFPSFIYTKLGFIFLKASFKILIYKKSRIPNHLLIFLALKTTPSAIHILKWRNNVAHERGSALH